MAYAAAYNYLMDSLQISSIENQIKIIEILSEIPRQKRNKQLRFGLSRL